MRRFSTSAPALRRVGANPRPLVLRPPQEPRAKDVQVPADHPLWQFFGQDKQFLRKPDEVVQKGSAWSIPQLRRKSFDDLHALWWISLKEINRLKRESTVIKMLTSRPGEETTKQGSSGFDDTIRDIGRTMRRVRHVLAERYHAHRASELELGDAYPRLFSEFSKEYLEADSNADIEVTGQLERFQYAFFGINPLLEGNVPDPKVLRGLYAVARLKLLRYGGDQKQVTSVNNVREAFLIFSSEHTPEGIAETIGLINELRADADAAPGADKDEIQVLADLMYAARPTGSRSDVSASEIGES